MTLSVGTLLGPYRIEALLGSGGMGEVYRARDTRLERTVAIKVLPSEVSANSDRRARFEREAKALARLEVQVETPDKETVWRTCWIRGAGLKTLASTAAHY